MRRKPYRLVNWIEGLEVMSYHNTLKETREAANQHFIDTDGECDLTIEAWDSDIYAYVFAETPSIWKKTLDYVYGE